jgi:farnesyl diphosphate synthase
LGSLSDCRMFSRSSLLVRLGSSASALCAPVTSANPTRTVIPERFYSKQDAPAKHPMYSPNEKRDFMAVFTDLNRHLSFQDLPEELVPLLGKHLTKCIQYNVPDGKKNRGFSVPFTYKLLTDKSQHTPENIKLAMVLGWTVEFLQAFFLVADDIMDQSETRRGKKCWYKQPGIGLTAFNDSILLEASVYTILKQYFGEKENYMSLVQLYQEVTKYTSLGQALDLLSAETFQHKVGKVHSLDHFTMERYKGIVKYKTSYYSFYLPIALAMQLAEIKDPNLYLRAEHILLSMGHYFQVQDDYLDCFGDPEVTGKLGTDIQDGKCSWLVVMALQRADHKQTKELALRYGSKDEKDVQWVKNLYQDLGLKKLFSKYEAEFYDDIMTMIQQIRGDELPQQIFHSLLARIYKREK